MKHILSKVLLFKLLLVVIVFSTSCEKDSEDTDPVEEEEVDYSNECIVGTWEMEYSCGNGNNYLETFRFYSNGKGSMSRTACETGCFVIEDFDYTLTGGEIELRTTGLLICDELDDPGYITIMSTNCDGNIWRTDKGSTNNIDTFYRKGSGSGGTGGTGGTGGSGGTGGQDSETGAITFWTDRDFGCGNISVNVTGEGSGTITGYYDSFTPECGSSSNANFSNLSAGTYNYTASCNDYSWSGTVNVQADQCTRFQLTVDGNSGGNGGSGGGGGGSTTTGTATFYLTSDVGCGNIYVSLASKGSQTISSYYESNPGCGASGNANFYNLEHGNYEYSATSDGGCTWSGYLTIDRDCQTVEFTL